ncbi:acetyl-CoA carboxylase biotin carboxyl carrier protein [Mogibacterium sp.]
MEKYLELTERLVGVFDRSSSDYLEIKISDYALTLKKGSSVCAVPSVPVTEVVAPAVSLQPIAPASSSAVQARAVAEANDVSNLEASAPAKEVATASLNTEVVKSPIVGVFYAAKDPSSPPFVKVGDTVKKGDVLCILESMKMMNEIRSDYDGVIKEIKCKNEELVEFDQVMFVLEKGE